MEITIESRVARSPDQVWAALGDELVMFNFEAGQYFGLNAIGAAVWERLQEPRRVADICADLQRAFAVSPERCASSVLTFLRSLEQRGLVVVVE
jgi:hypothetical protein